MELILKPEQVEYPNGLSIAVQGFEGDIGHAVASQVFIEVYEGTLRVHVWDGNEDPVTTIEIARVEREPIPAGASKGAPCPST